MDYITEHHDIKSITIFVGNSIDLYIDVKILNSEIYVNHDYKMSPLHSGDYIYGSKNLQSYEDLLDELQDLELINCYRNIKGARSVKN